MDATTPSQFYPRILRRCASCVPFLQGSLRGLWLSVVVILWLHLTIMTWGFSSLVVGSWMMAGVATAIFVIRARSQSGPLSSAAGHDTRAFWLRNLSLLLVGGLSVSTPLWWGVWDEFLARLLRGSLIGWGMAVVCQAGLLTSVGAVLLLSCPSQRIQRTPGCWWGMGMGLWLIPICLAPFVPMPGLAAAAMLGLLGLNVWINRGAYSFPIVGGESPAESDSPANWQSVLTACSLPLTAGLLPVAYRMVSQLQLETLLLVYGVLCALCVGVALTQEGKGTRRVLWGSLLAAVVLAASPLWLRGQLIISAGVTVLSVQLVLRLLVVIAFFAPLGFLLGTICRDWMKKTQRQGSSAASALAGTLAAAAGLGLGLIGAWSLLPVVGPALLASVLLSLLVCVTWLGDCGFVRQRSAAGASDNSETLLSAAGTADANGAEVAFKEHAQQSESPAQTSAGSRFRNGWKRNCWLPALPALVVSLLIPSGYAPGVSSRTLFSTQMFQAWYSGTHISQLSGLDEARLLGVRETQTGTLTFWRHQADHTQIRENGIPAGRIGGQQSLVPQPAAGVLSAVLPLSLHPTPRQVLLMGLESGMGLKTTLEFPVMEVTCLEENAGLVQELKTGILADLMADSLADDRVTVRQENRHLHLRKVKSQYDVILESPGHSAAYRSASRFSASHYRWVARHLAEGGIYCQRFIYADYGPAVLKSLSRTMEQELGYVTAFDTAPGEVLFVAARSAEDVFTEGLLDRLAAPQARRCFASLGWDWSVAMNLTRFEADHFQGVRDYGSFRETGGLVPFRLPGEVLRWGPKLDETRISLAEKSTKLMVRYQEDPQLEDALRRLSDVAAREQVLAQHPDQFWVYRKSVKKRLTESPRSVIEPVKGEGLQKRIHPDDQRRLDFFETLGQAAQAQPCRVTDLQRIEQYAHPYDPMISYFLHAEIARLYQRCEPPRADLELKHHLHVLYFGGQQERSVRGIHRCLELLSQAETDLDAAAQYDHINSLLELLKRRWQLRRGTDGITRSVLLLDIKDSLESSQQGLKRLEALGHELQIPAPQTAARIEQLEKALIRELKSHRAHLLNEATHRSL